MQKIVKFAGAELLTVKENDRVLVALKPICEALNMDYSAQMRLIRRDETLASTVAITSNFGADGKSRDMFCLPLNHLNGWLFKICPSRIRNRETRELVLKYQRECYQVLAEHFMTARSAISNEVLLAAEKRLKRTARLFAAYLRYEIRSRVLDLRHVPAEMVGSLAMEAEAIPCSYGGFERAVWDIGEPSPAFIELTAKLLEQGKLKWMEVIE